MKFESQILATLFVACFSICALVMGAMIKATPASVQLASASKATVAAVVASDSCRLPTHCSRAHD